MLSATCSWGCPDSSVDYSRALSYIRGRNGVSVEEVPDYAVSIFCRIQRCSAFCS